MGRILLLVAGAVVASMMAATAVASAATPTPIGISVYPFFGPNQLSSIGNFTGQVGQGLFARDNGPNFVHFEADMRFMKGAARFMGRRQSPTPARSR